MTAEAIKIFIASEPCQLLPAKVLAWTIRKHSSRVLDIRILDTCPVSEASPYLSRRAGTGFSFYRFAIPQLCGYQGRAIYLDSDMQVFSDIGELWDYPMENKSILCTVENETPQGWAGKNVFTPGRQMSVLLLDCGKLDWNFVQIAKDWRAGVLDYKRLMTELYITPQDQVAGSLPQGWNHLEKFIPGKTRLLHYTVGHQQPWYNDRNTLRQVWHQDFQNAIHDGALKRKDVLKAVLQGYAKPSLICIAGMPSALMITASIPYLFFKFMRAIRKRLF